MACAAHPAVTNEPIPYPAAVTTNRASREVPFALTVDTLGAVVPSSVTVFPGTDDAFAKPVRDVVPRWRFRAAFRGGRRVPQRLHMVAVVRPPEADAVAIAAKSPPLADPTKRTIFFKKP